MQRRWMRIGIGVFVALALVLLGTLIVLFNSLPRMFRATNVYTARFDDATGLSPGAPVRRSGVPIGVVGAIVLNDQTGTVDVRLELDAPHVIRKDEQVTLVSSLLGGDSAIDLVTVPPPEGQAPDRTPIPPGSVVLGVRATGVNQLISRASEVVPTTQETLNDIRKSMQRIEKMSPLVEDTFREYRDLGRALNNSVPALRRPTTTWTSWCGRRKTPCRRSRATPTRSPATPTTWPPPPAPSRRWPSAPTCCCARTRTRSPRPLAT